MAKKSQSPFFAPTYTQPNFQSMSIVAKLSSISATAEHLLHSSRQSVVGFIGAT